MGYNGVHTVDLSENTYLLLLHLMIQVEAADGVHLYQVVELMDPLLKPVGVVGVQRPKNELKNHKQDNSRRCSLKLVLGQLKSKKIQSF